MLYWDLTNFIRWLRCQYVRKTGRNQLRDLPGKEEKEDLKLQAKIFQAQELLKVSDHFLFSSQLDRLIEICIQASRFAVINKFVLVYDPLERAKLLFCSSEWINAGIDYIAKELASLFVTALLELKSNQTPRVEFTFQSKGRGGMRCFSTSESTSSSILQIIQAISPTLQNKGLQCVIKDPQNFDRLLHPNSITRFPDLGSKTTFYWAIKNGTMAELVMHLDRTTMSW